MKVRSDYVTNSSSSSFIIAFSSTDTIASELNELMKSGYFEQVYIDCSKAEKMDIQKMLETASDEMRCDVRYDVAEYAEMVKGMPWEKVFEWEKTADFEDAVQHEIDKRLEAIKEKSKDKGVFVHVSYSDESGEYELEHHIVPYLSNCLAVFSHH